jgi:glycosylphosphatidylinositol phospholipase D
MSVSSAGDVNGDGIGDVIIGAPNAEPSPGTAYVVFGTRNARPASVDLTALDGANGFRIVATPPNGQLGFSVSAAGDVNGDGIDDIIVGAPSVGTGAAYVVFGRTGQFPADLDLATLDGLNGFRIEGAVAGAGLGHGVGAAGDVNGDGIDDVVIGSGTSSDALAYIVFGRRTAQAGRFAPVLGVASLDGQNGFRIAGSGGRVSVSGAGDVNGDGIADVILGSPLSASAYIVFGRDVARSGQFPASVAVAALDGRSGFKIGGASANSWLGSSVTAADVNGDGLADVVVGAPLNSVPNGTWAGAAFVVFGRDTARGAAFPPVLDVKTLIGANGFRFDGSSGERMGFSVGAAGDLDGDGYDDLVIGAPYGSPSGSTARGAVFVVFGRGNGFPGYLNQYSRQGVRITRIDGVAPHDAAGFSVAGAGDVNGDGALDLVVGAAFASPNGMTRAGVTYVVLGSRDVGAPVTTIAISPAASAAGWHNGPVSFTVAATDAPGGSGVAESRCALDPATPPVRFEDLPAGGCAGLTAAGDGLHVLYAASRDSAGNQEIPVSMSVRIDATPPVVTVTGVIDGATYVAGRVPGAGCATRDALSGVARRATLRTSGGGPKSVGTHTATCSGALDRAGNAGSAAATYRVVRK